MIDSDTISRLKRSKVISKDDDLETLEVTKGIFHQTEFPKPKTNIRMYYESYKNPVEEPYYWIMAYMKQVLSYHDFIKITDIFAASENSSFFGVSQQRLGLQQDKVSQYMATIGKMTKEMFQLVREIRILDERTSYYEKMDEGDKPAEITLKGIWIDMVEGGSKNPSSVYGMAQEVGFTTLPDLFFDVSVKKADDIERIVEALDFNRKVKEVLCRKLKTFLTWKETTYKELKTRRIFTIRYLRQHFNAIKMYIAWVKPYLRNIRKMQLNERMMDSPGLVAAFESTMIEIEFIAQKKKKQDAPYSTCVLATFQYRTMPAMSFQTDYQRGPIHIGRMELTLRGYSWNDEDIKHWKDYRNSEDLALLTSIDGSLKAAMDALGDEVEKYLREAGEELPEKKEEKKKKQDSAIDPFISIFGGFKEIFTGFAGEGGEKKQSKMEKFELDNAKNEAGNTARADCFQIFDKYKKAHGWLSW